MSRINHLREKMLNAEHGRHRILLPADWSTSHLNCSIPERKAHALKLVLENWKQANHTCPLTAVHEVTAAKHTLAYS